jgi:hypothetical protein
VAVFEEPVVFLGVVPPDQPLLVLVNVCPPAPPPPPTMMNRPVVDTDHASSSNDTGGVPVWVCPSCAADGPLPAPDACPCGQNLSLCIPSR